MQGIFWFSACLSQIFFIQYHVAQSVPLQQRFPSVIATFVPLQRQYTLLTTLVLGTTTQMKQHAISDDMSDTSAVHVNEGGGGPAII